MAAKTSEKAPEPVQDALGATKPPLVDQTAKRAAATALVASWLRGKSFGLNLHGGHLDAAADLVYRLTRSGYIIWYVGDCPECATNPGLCPVHD